MPATVDSYIAAQPPDVGQILERLRTIILAVAPAAGQKLKYGMPGFFLGTQHIFYLGAWRDHVGLYPVYPQAAALERAIAPLRVGKDTLRLVYAHPIPYPLIRRLVVARVRQMQRDA